MNPNSHYTRKARRKIRQAAVAALGGICIRCGSTEGLEIDHVHGGPLRDGLDYYAYHLRIAEGLIGGKQLLCKPCHVEKSREDIGCVPKLFVPKDQRWACACGQTGTSNSGFTMHRKKCQV